MYAVIRQYSGASQLIDQLESRKDDVERVIRGVPGLVSYTLLRTDYGGVSVTVCQDKAGTDESVRLAAEGIGENFITAEWLAPPMLFEGNTIVQVSL